MYMYMYSCTCVINFRLLFQDPIILKNMNEGWSGLSPNKLLLNSPDLTPQDAGMYNHQLMPVIPHEFTSDLSISGGFNNQPMMYYNTNSVGSSNDGILSPSINSPQNILSNSPDANMTTPAELPSQVSSTRFVGDTHNNSFQPNSLLNPSLANYPSNAVIQSNLTTPFLDPSSLPQDLSTVHPLQFESHNVNMEDYLTTLVPNGDLMQNSKNPLLPNSGHVRSKPVSSKHNILGKRYRAVNKKAMPSKLIANSPVSFIPAEPVDRSPHQPRSNVATSIISGNQSDTSSGVSSSHKMSISESSTPSSPSSLHDFITCDSSDEEMFPIREPYPGLGDMCEYMLTNPIRPPSPPLGTQVELTPNVPIYEVCITVNDLDMLCA